MPQNLRKKILTRPKLSKGEICVANCIPPANGARQGSYYLQKVDFSQKTGLKNHFKKFNNTG